MLQANVTPVLMELTVQWGKQKHPQHLWNSECIRGGCYENVQKRWDFLEEIAQKLGPTGHAALPESRGWGMF